MDPLLFASTKALICEAFTGGNIMGKYLLFYKITLLSYSDYTYWSVLFPELILHLALKKKIKIIIIIL